jgi:chromosome segregation protein
MKIKKLELVGFKSFVDRTVLHFDHDVLAIVGPNGCGKSNIVDAIRWCMGEQSARHLRGRSMDDVIFSGSESRSPNDYAEVTITFDTDTADELPAEFRDYPEIAVTRRLHRTGDSEYLVNKTPVRLRDVTDLFLGTGAGTKAYSIVEQGKVGLIVSAKPEDRRMLIEEAAGITKFKSRKKQAEKKMELTQQNLLRVGDIVTEIERSLASLKRQAAKAERYVAYRGELEDLQLHESAHRYLELVGWIKLESSEVERISAVNDAIRTESAHCERELDAARVDVRMAEDAQQAAHEASFAADSAVAVEQASIERAQDRLKALAEREQQAEGEKREMDSEALRRERERDLIAGEIAALAATETAQLAALVGQESALAELAASHASADAGLAQLRQTIGAASTEIASGEASLAGLARRRTETATRCAKLGAEREAIEGKRLEAAAHGDDLRRDIEDLRVQHLATAAEKADLDQRLNELKQRIRLQEQTLEHSKSELSHRRSRHGALEEMHTRLEGVGAGAKALVGTRDACVLGLVADRVEAPRELTQALAGLLGVRLETVVVTDLERGITLLEELGRTQRGRATIVPAGPAFIAGAGDPLPTDDGVVMRLIDGLRFAPEDEPLVRALVKDAIVVRDFATALRLRSAGARADLVTVEGAVLHADGRTEGGQGDLLAAGLLESKREARELAEEIASLEKVVADQLGALQASRADIVQTGAALDRARLDAHARELALVTAEKDLQKNEAQRDELARRQSALVFEEGELARALDEARFEHEQVDRDLGEARARIEVAQAQLQDAETTLAEARERLDTERQSLLASKVTVAATREKFAAARGTQTRLARSAKELEERSARLSDELVANSRAFGETAAQVLTHTQALHEAAGRSACARDELNRTRSVAEELRGRLLQRDGAIKELRARMDAVREGLQAHEMALREKELSMRHLLSSVGDKFRGLHLPRVVGDYHMRPAPDEVTHARIEELGRLIERMGSVNLDAMREHAEAEQRFVFYTTQRADLEKALSDLQRAIQQMNRESRRLFEETFVAVNERFREIFPKMFRGGRAELRMTNPDDLLDTGIDIVAQPPGKKLSNIELMSGGEKALTAVSLIFAIFQIKPSPFCILDEVDAPLDDANVARYNEMVRSMTDGSQFILITHVKRTMQTVDVLYGVTMAEPGVSKIVSVRINESQSRASEPQVAVA